MKYLIQVFSVSTSFDVVPFYKTLQQIVLPFIRLDHRIYTFGKEKASQKKIMSDNGCLRRCIKSVNVYSFISPSLNYWLPI